MKPIEQGWTIPTTKGSHGVDMGAHNTKLARQRTIQRKLAKRARRVNRG